MRKQKLPRPKARTIEFRSLKYLDSNTFLSDLRNVPWDSAYIYDNIDDIRAHWSGLYKQVLDEHAPVKRIQLRNNQLPWISPDIQKQIRIRNRLYKKFRRAPTDSNWYKYKEQRNRVTGLKRRAVKNFCAEAASGTSSAGLFWKKMKPLLPNNKSNTDGTIIIFFKCFKENGPRYITNLFKPRVTPYNLRSSGLNVEQRPYNSRFFHGSYSYIISRIQLPPAAKNAANVPAFINHLNTTNFGGCQCSSCLK